MRKILSISLDLFNRAAARLRVANESERGGGFSDWIDRHFEWRKFFRNELLNRSTFRPQTFRDYLGYSGTVLVALILFQFITGFLMLFYYKANPAQAFASLEALRNDVPYGMLYSNVHSIGSKLIFLIVFIHMFRIMIISAHRGPREPQWYIGAVLLALMLITGFSGYLLPWSQQSYWACVIGTEAVRALPLAGGAILRILRGGENVSGATLSRFFAFHATLFPVAIIVLIWLHIKTVWKTGVIAPTDMFASVEEGKCSSCATCRKVCSFGSVRMVERSGKNLPAINVEKCNACRACVDNCPSGCISLKSNSRMLSIEPIFPNNFMRRFLAVFITLVIFIGSVYFLHGILMSAKEPANPLLTPDRIKPEWYFLASYQVLRELPNELMGLIAVAAIYLLILFLPKLDRSGPREAHKRPVYLFLVIGGIVSFVILTIVGWLS